MLTSRSVLTRRAPLKRGKPLARSTAIRRVNHARIRARRAACFGKQAALCRTMPCTACWATPVQVHHEPPRSCGGTDSASVPLCMECHELRHRVGLREFERRTHLNLRAEAARLARLLVDEEEHARLHDSAQKDDRR